MTTFTATTPERYSTVAIVLHWAIAVLLLFQLGLGFGMGDLPRGPGKIAVVRLHISVGVTILLLTFARIGWRFAKPRPLAHEQHPALKRLAGAVHALLYFVMLAGPLTGWAIISTGKSTNPVTLFGTVPWFRLPLPKGWHDGAEEVHELLAFLLIGLIVLHLAGALRHHLKRDALVGRMLPGGMAASHPGRTAGVAIALAAAALAVWAGLSGGGVAG
ncbi:MAG: cytochrome b [Novosphingobium sp.]